MQGIGVAQKAHTQRPQLAHRIGRPEFLPQQRKAAAADGGRASQDRQLFAQQHAGSLPRRRQCRIQPGGPAAHHQNITSPVAPHSRGPGISLQPRVDLGGRPIDGVQQRHAGDGGSRHGVHPRGAGMQHAVDEDTGRRTADGRCIAAFQQLDRADDTRFIGCDAHRHRPAVRLGIDGSRKHPRLPAAGGQHRQTKQQNREPSHSLSLPPLLLPARPPINVGKK